MFIGNGNLENIVMCNSLRLPNYILSRIKERKIVTSWEFSRYKELINLLKFFNLSESESMEMECISIGKSLFLGLSYGAFNNYGYIPLELLFKNNLVKCIELEDSFFKYCEKYQRYYTPKTIMEDEMKNFSLKIPILISKLIIIKSKRLRRITRYKNSE